MNWQLRQEHQGDSCKKLTPAKFEAAAVCLLKSLERGDISQNLYPELGLKALTKSSLHNTGVLNGPTRLEVPAELRSLSVRSSSSSESEPGSDG